MQAACPGVPIPIPGGKLGPPGGAPADVEGRSRPAKRRTMFTLIACVTLVVAGILGAMHMETRLGAGTDAERSGKS
ncbi:hypothetical protein NUM3379_30070 [Kineococcus sp. NUM-3379]